MSTPLTTAARATGAWADGDRTPLNDNERFKLEDDGLNVRQRIETIFSREGFGSIPVDDLRGRMRWWGLYTQRRPGIDGGQTAKLSADELDDSYFCLLYTSDAADERSSVDLGGRRIINKKKQKKKHTDSRLE